MEPKQISESKLPEQQAPSKQIIVYICPVNECPNFYASPEFREDLADMHEPSWRRTDSGPKHDGPTRIECPTCRLRGVKSIREPFVVTSVVPLQKVMKVLRDEKENDEEKAAA